MEMLSLVSLLHDIPKLYDFSLICETQKRKNYIKLHKRTMYYSCTKSRCFVKKKKKKQQQKNGFAVVVFRAAQFGQILFDYIYKI